MTGLATVVEDIPEGDKRWWNKNQVQAFIDSLAPHQAERLQRFLNAKEKTVRTAYRRTRSGVVRWEIREEEIAGCLRTARGGSSRQAVVICENGKIEVRWMTGTEYAVSKVLTHVSLAASRMLRFATHSAMQLPCQLSLGL